MFWSVLRRREGDNLKKNRTQIKTKHSARKSASDWAPTLQTRARCLWSCQWLLKGSLLGAVSSSRSVTYICFVESFRLVLAAYARRASPNLWQVFAQFICATRVGDAKCMEFMAGCCGSPTAVVVASASLAPNPRSYNLLYIYRQRS